MRSQMVVAVLQTTPVQILPPNPKRVGLLLSGDGNNTISASFRPGMALSTGFTVSVQSPNLHVRYEDIGDNITGALYAVGAANGAMLTVWEAFL